MYTEQELEQLKGECNQALDEYYAWLNSEVKDLSTVGTARPLRGVKDFDLHMAENRARARKRYHSNHLSKHIARVMGWPI